ncbi:unnamed protein product [Prorocentrum cordatum]|uniref:Uncharacterized protein n=1 Tax=Prorocentrum cordatum TaxID=2364126 RepID=A0ABN9XUW3_9DINO|nr:unnamed protein product [Polarella glacialis]
MTFGYPVGLGDGASFARFDVSAGALRRFGGWKHGQVVRDDRSGEELAVVGVKREACTREERLWLQPLGSGGREAVSIRAGDVGHLSSVYREGSRTVLKHVELQQAAEEAFAAAEDSDGEDLLLCAQCRLPLSTQTYPDEGGRPLHAECVVQSSLRQARRDERRAELQEAARKRELRRRFGIGWCADKCAAGMGTGMVGVALRGSSMRRVAVSDPVASVCPEYLSAALRARLEEGCEPTFSLDPSPVGPGADGAGREEGSMQVKRFAPAWLRGTSAGEVLFQADYHLKELSMGECRQPVVGMRSCLEYADEECAEGAWRAREWFVVRGAEVWTSDEGLLIPRVRMGVEAREQLLGPGGLEDKTVTSPAHPLVRYAREFTDNFELIAERRSVFHHLRELAKAAVLAKFLLEAGAQVEEIHRPPIGLERRPGWRGGPRRATAARRCRSCGTSGRPAPRGSARGTAGWCRRAAPGGAGCAACLAGCTSAWTAASVNLPAVDHHPPNPDPLEQ